MWPGRTHFQLAAMTLAVLGCWASGATDGVAQEAADFFRQNCASCHTIGGGRLTGPDLKDVGKRKDHEWLVRFVLDPKAVIDGGDSYAQQLMQESRGVLMPTIFGISKDRVESLLVLIEAESKLPKSQFAGMQMSEKPFTPQDVARGKEFFTGLRSFASGAPACISCHEVAGLDGLGGGKIGPDLTKVYERLQGRKTLAAWLMAPATPTMLPVFKRHPLSQEEIIPLVAFLEKEDKEGSGRQTAAQINFFLLALAGAAVLLVAFDALWKKRFRSVRRVLVRSSQLAAVSSQPKVPADIHS